MQQKRSTLIMAALHRRLCVLLLAFFFLSPGTARVSVTHQLRSGDRKVKLAGLQAEFSRELSLLGHAPSVRCKVLPQAKDVHVRLAGDINTCEDILALSYDIVHRSQMRQTAYKLTGSAHGATVVAATPFVESTDGTRGACGPLLSGPLRLVDATIKRQLAVFGDAFASWHFPARLLSLSLSRGLAKGQTVAAQAECDFDEQSKSMSVAYSCRCALGGESQYDLATHWQLSTGDETLNAGCSLGWGKDIGPGRTLRATIEQPLVRSKLGRGKFGAQYVDTRLEPGAAWVAKVSAHFGKAPTFVLLRQWSF